MNLSCDAFIESLQPNFWQKKILVACSGGIDSMVLSHYLHHKNVDMSLAHVNFKLRANESDEDVIFVTHFAQQYNIPLFLHAFDTAERAQKEGRSIQETARLLRYQWFEDLVAQEGFDLVVTAHHLDDQMETFLFHAFRGTGMKGITGIPALRIPFFRPLLQTTKEEIIKYAQFWQIGWREDKSNAKTDYTRNAIRHMVLPKLKTIFPEANKGFLTTLSHLTSALAYFHQSLDKDLNTLLKRHQQSQKIAVKDLQSHSSSASLLYHWLSPYGFKAWHDIQHLLNADTGKQVLSSTHRLFKNRSELILEPLQSIDFESLVFDTLSDFLENKQFVEAQKVNKLDITDRNTIFVDPFQIKFPLILRKWQKGDWFIPKGMCGKKKVSRFFIDQKFSLTEKESCLILSDAEGIIWIVGHRQDERYLVKNVNARSLLKISVSD